MCSVLDFGTDQHTRTSWRMVLVGLATPWRIGSWCCMRGENHLISSNLSLSQHLKNYTRGWSSYGEGISTKKTNAAWCRDIQVGQTFQLLIADVEAAKPSFGPDRRGDVLRERTLRRSDAFVRDIPHHHAVRR
jgi:hypothetical protein